MLSRVFGAITFVAGLLLAVVASAQTVFPNPALPGDGSAVVSQLQRQEQMDEFKAKSWTQEPITQQDYYVQEQQDRQLIARIEAGQPVSHAELEQALRRVDTDY
jgi:hypothetical protein